MAALTRGRPARLHEGSSRSGVARGKQASKRWFGEGRAWYAAHGGGKAVRGANPAAESSPDLKCSGGEVGGCSGRRGRGEERARGAGWGHGGAGECRWRTRGGVGGWWAGTRGGGDRRRRSRAPVELEEEDEQEDHFAITEIFRGLTEN